VSFRLICVIAVLALCGCSGSQMTVYRLQKDAGSLGSLAAEGQLLADMAANAGAPSSYVSTHSSELGADAGDLASVVGSTDPTAQTARPRHQLLELATEATALFEELEHAPNDRGKAQKIATRFGHIADSATKIEEQG
jgi:hypothetical protein